MNTSLKDRLKNSEAAQRRSMTVVPDADEKSPALKSASKAAAGSESTGSAQESTVEQLEGLYKEIEYMESHFPEMTISALTDLCLQQQKKLLNTDRKASADAPDYGVIPGPVFANLEIMNQEFADSADIGIIEVDDKGSILIYNSYEQKLAGVTLKNAKGKNFFHDIAPCTANRFFRGRFKSGVAEEKLDIAFQYTFTYKINPTPVHIHLFREPTTKRNFIFVKMI